MEFYRFWLLFLSTANFVAELLSTPIKGGHIVNTPSGSEPKYPFVVSLQDVLIDGETKHFCGGSLINRKWILTAAHCLWRKNITKVVAVIGHENLKDPATKTDYYELEFVKFATFQPITYQNDIALVRLQKDYSGTSTFMKLPEYGMKPNRNRACTIIGYGALGHIGLTSSRLIEANVNVVTNKECRKKLGRVWAPKRGDNTVCAVGENQDACQGDSGGPLICNYRNTDYVFGIVSHGIACGGKGIPSLYTVTVPYINWIRNIITNSDDHKITM